MTTILFLSHCENYELMTSLIIGSNAGEDSFAHKLMYFLNLRQLLYAQNCEQYKKPANG